MKVIGQTILDDFARRNPKVKAQIEAWLAEADKADWKKPIDVKASYGTASIIDGSGVVFNLKGNRYRLYVKISYKTQVVIVKKIGTHDEYMKWNL